MTSSPSPPDLSGLSLGGGQRLHDNHDLDAGQGRNQLHYFATTAPGVGAAGVAGSGPYATLGASPLKNKPATRSGLPSQWVDTPGGDTRAISPHMSDLSSQSASPPPQLGFGMPPGINTPGGMSTPGLGLDEEIIPTAIVIKNIPFNVKRESLLDIIASLNIPTPYAFNYHLDQSGAFRGLAFANFRQPQDADAVVVALNGFDVQGRKLRVEYKKVLQAGEKERIEREKALRRMRSMQLEKEQQHAIAAQQTYDEYGQPVPTAPPAFTSSRSFSGMGNAPWGTPGVAAAYGTPPVPQMPQMPPLNTFNSMNSVASIGSLAPGTPGGGLAPMTPGRGAATELDLNDPATLEIYSRILLFKDDPMRDELAFSRQLTAKQRRVVHLVAQKLGVFHYSVGEGEDRYAVVTRIPPENQQPQQAAPRLSRAPSAYHLSHTASQQAASPAPSLRSKKSMPDMAALRASAPRLNTRPSNTNIREGFATIASPARRAPSGGLNGLFGPTSGTPPPVPMLPSTVTTPSTESPTIVRQPRGPGALGFMQRQNSKGPELVRKPSVQSLDTRSHEPFEI